jgi:hypothetical protein
MKFGLFNRTNSGRTPLEIFEGDSLYAHEGTVTVSLGKRAIAVIALMPGESIKPVA